MKKREFAAKVVDEYLGEYPRAHVIVWWMKITAEEDVFVESDDDQEYNVKAELSAIKFRCNYYYDETKKGVVDSRPLINRQVKGPFFDIDLNKPQYINEYQNSPGTHHEKCGAVVELFFKQELPAVQQNRG